MIYHNSAEYSKGSGVVGGAVYLLWYCLGSTPV